jgi:outer membrane protein OmpA-like peptidoglycan-associated protein
MVVATAVPSAGAGTGLAKDPGPMLTRHRAPLLLALLLACHRDEQRPAAPTGKLRSDSVFTDDDPATRKSCVTDAECGAGAICHPGHGRCFTTYPSARMLDAGYKLEDCKLTNVYFPFDSTDLLEEAQRWLEYDVRCLKVRGGGHVLIEAHADARGEASHNMELSRRRGEAVKLELQRLGIAADAIEVAPHGDKLPLTNGKSEREQAWNRRVELRVK